MKRNKFKICIFFEKEGWFWIVYVKEQKDTKSHWMNVTFFFKVNSK